MSVICVIVLVCGFVAVAVLIWASASIRSGVYLRSHCRARGCGRAVALTFDDGPDPERTPEVLGVLRKHGVKATFFLVGEKVAAHPQLVQRIVAEGHIVGNHTYTHSGLFPLCRGRKVREELQRTTETIAYITGRRPRLFRPPFGVTNPIIGCAVRREGLVCVGWSVRSFDTIVGTPRPQVLARVLRGVHDGAVILLHDRCAGSAALLDALLCELAEKKYEIKTLEQLFDLEAYEN